MATPVYDESKAKERVAADRLLQDGILTNNVGKVELALSRDANPEQLLRYPYNALTQACHNSLFYNDSLKIVELLLKAGAGPNSSLFSDDFKTQFPLHTIVYAGTLDSIAEYKEERLLKRKEKLITMLITGGADPLLVDRDGKTILHRLVNAKADIWIDWLSKIEAIRPFLEQMAQMKARNGNTPFGEFVGNLHSITMPAKMKAMGIHLLHLGSNITDTSSDGQTLEEFMMGNGYIATWRDLIAVAATQQNPGQENARKPRVL